MSCLARILVFATAIMTFANVSSGEIINTDTTLYQSVPPGGLWVRDGESGPTVVTILDGAEIAPLVHVEDSSIVNMHGGVARRGVVLGADAVMNLYGGQIGEGHPGVLGVGGNAVLNMSGGTATADVMIGGRASITGGRLLQKLDVTAFSIVSFAGGTVEGDVVAGRSGRLHMSGGSVSGNLIADDYSIVNLYGGSIGGYLLAERESSTIHVWGYDLDLTDDLLTGTLSDGTPMNHWVDPTGKGQIILHQIPEPSVLVTLLMAAITGLVVFRRR